MAEALVDPVLGAIVLGASGIVLWIVTQIHLLRVARSVRGEIESKRAATEAFVKKELTDLKDSIGGQLGGFRATVEAQLTKMSGGIQATFNQLDQVLVEMPERIQARAMGERGVQERLLRQQIDEAAGELTEVAEAELMPYADQGDQLSLELMRWVKKPIDPTYEERSPIGAGLLRLMKAAAAEQIPRTARGFRPGQRPQGKSPYGV